MAYQSQLIASRADLAQLIAVAIGKKSAAIYRSGDRWEYGGRPRRSTVSESAWHPATQLDSGEGAAYAKGRRPHGHQLKDIRGSAEDRRRRKSYLLTTYGDGYTAPCAFCHAELSWETVTVDRFPIPGREGGRYTRDNIRPACGPCNSDDGWQAQHAATPERTSQ